MIKEQDVRIELLKNNFNELEELLNKRVKVPPFGSVINVSNVKRKLKELENNVKEALRENEKIVKISQEILKKQNDILKKAQEDSEKLIEHHKQRLWNEPLVAQAEAKAKEILSEAKMIEEKIIRNAEQRASEMEQKINEYVNKTLDDTERILLMRAQEVRENRINAEKKLAVLRIEHPKRKVE